MENVIASFLIEQALVLVPVLWIIGYVLKKTTAFPDWLIPGTLLIAGIIGGVLVVGGTTGAVQGILAAGAAVLGHQMVVQNRKRS